jgi:hypothetical protein
MIASDAILISARQNGLLPSSFWVLRGREQGYRGSALEIFSKTTLLSIKQMEAVTSHPW